MPAPLPAADCRRGFAVGGCCFEPSSFSCSSSSSSSSAGLVFDWSAKEWRGKNACTKGSFLRKYLSAALWSKQLNRRRDSLHVCVVVSHVDHISTKTHAVTNMLDLYFCFAARGITCPECLLTFVFLRSPPFVLLRFPVPHNASTYVKRISCASS